MDSSLLSFFTDVILRGPTIGSMFMCLAASLIGVVMFLRKQSLMGEALSHAAYPGVIIAVIFCGIFSIDADQEFLITLFIMIGATLTALLGLFFIYLLEKKFKIRSDSALCFTLSAFFGIGVMLASEVQFSYTSLYRQVQSYLYGQAATMTDIHILIYGLLSLIIAAVLFSFEKEIQAITFNAEYARSLGINVRFVNILLFMLTVLAVVVGIRSVGVVLMSAMFIAPAAAARQYTNKFHVMLLLSGFFGLISGFLGNYFSVKGTYYLAFIDPGARLSLATGPMIVIVVSLICVFSLLFAPERGLLLRAARIIKFRYQCIRENLLKALWRLGADREFSFDEIAKYQTISRFYLRYIIRSLIRNGWIKKTSNGNYMLTVDGKHRAAHIVRLHRLWEVYLADQLGTGVERVHHNAEEMEHIITPELEQELTLLLNDPKIDPHHQRIPSKDELL